MSSTPYDGVRAARPADSPDAPNRVSYELPAHLRSWELPPEWAWGSEGVFMEYRHYQEIRDALGRSLSLVSAPDPAHVGWLAREARYLAHRNHPAIPTTYHYWAPHSQSKRGPGYLRRWISSETIGGRVRRTGPEEIPAVMRMIRAVGSTLAYLHDSGQTHGGMSPEVVWASPSGRFWVLGWQWAMLRQEVPDGLLPDRRWTPMPPEWKDAGWQPSLASDQWQLAATCFLALTGEMPPSSEAPPIRLMRPECPQALAHILDQALVPDPTLRHRSVSSMLRALERVSGTRSMFVSAPAIPSALSEEGRLRWAVGDDYEILGFLGKGTFGSVWRARDLSLEREVALKMLHPAVAEDERAVARFRREARLAAMLAHPAIIPIYDWDARGEVTWYTMELAEGGSVAELVARAGPRPFEEVAPQVEAILDALNAAHTNGIVHRDLKPENVLIDRYRRWRITDFGIAKGEDEQAGATGTPAFAAPEQLLGEAQGPAVDCFGVAAIIYYVLAGMPPFDARDTQALLAQQLGARYDESVLPPPLQPFIKRGLSPDPTQRFSDAGTMKEAWREVVEEMEREARRGDTWWGRVLG
ncbi:MAG: protein kinase [Gemmatimonadetes bacterium]|jgi:serine/threonine protein kinase|nr:protein kinase [Gemmatimonadota bacterium]MBK6458119.1 protein kinase [Gemmatimonadota bacterium]MBK8058053.1 protein kinase [Gemmatimonadota bacterium]MBK8648782.1 protein kinase [Gemmatimonadota bacterium]